MLQFMLGAGCCCCCCGLLCTLNHKLFMILNKFFSPFKQQQQNELTHLHKKKRVYVGIFH